MPCEGLPRRKRSGFAYSAGDGPLGAVWKEDYSRQRELSVGRCLKLS